MEEEEEEEEEGMVAKETTEEIKLIPVNINGSILAKINLIKCRFFLHSALVFLKLLFFIGALLYT